MEIFFGEDVVKVPSSFYGAIGVFYDGLSPFVQMLLSLHISSVAVYGILVFGALYDPSPATGVFGAAVDHRAGLTGFGLKVLHLHTSVSACFAVPVAVGGKGMSFRTSITVLSGVVSKVRYIVCRIRSHRSTGYIGYGHDGRDAHLLCGFQLTSGVVALV